jgi:DNA-binding response OmpR family regulator
MAGKQQKKVLIVEDEKPMARALQLKLEKEGFAVRTVFDGDEALELLLKEKFDIVLLDIMMPKKDGFAVLAELRERKDSTPVVVSTNLGQEEDAERAKKLGAQDYFVKSNTPIAEVIEHIKQTLLL